MPAVRVPFFFIALLLVAATGGAGQARAAGWLAPIDVSAPSNVGSVTCGLFANHSGVAAVDVAVTPSGEAVATWTRASGAAQEVQVAVRPPGGSFGPAQTLGTVQPCYVLGALGTRPKVAVDPQGNAVVVWAHPLATTSVVQASVRPASGVFGPPVNLSDASRTAQNDPDVAISGDGTIVAVWTWDNGTKNVVQTVTRPPGGSFPVAGTATTISDGAQDATAARVVSNERGDIAVVWRRYNGSNRIVQARVRPTGGTFAATMNLSDAGADADAPAVAIDPIGRATVLWTRSNLVESRFLTAAGALDGGIDNVSDTAETITYPSVALDGDNNAVAIWIGGPSFQTKVAARASRASFGTPQTISGPGSSNLLPAVAIGPAGTAVAVWSQNLTTVQAATRPPGGSFGGVEDVSRGPGAASIPNLAIDGEANAVVGWAFKPIGSPYLAQVTALDTAAPAISAVSVPGTATTGTPIGMSAAATDRWSGATVSWSFGDGGSAVGPSVAHAYGAPGVYTVTVTATDGAGNGTSTQRTIQVANPAVVVPASPAPVVVSPTPKVEVTLSFKYSAANTFTKLTSFSVKGVPGGATVTVGCVPPKRNGKTPRCPVRDFRKANARGTIKLTPFVDKRFKRNTVIEVRVTKTGMIGAVKRLTIRGRGGPTTSTSCLPLGAKTPSRC